MIKKSIFLIVLMSISLIGIAYMQVFWLQQTIEIKEQQFSNHVQSALSKAAKNIYLNELSTFSLAFEDLISQKKIAEKIDFSKFVYQQTDLSTNATFTYSANIFENKQVGTGDFFPNDSTIFTSINTKEDVLVVKRNFDSKEFSKMNPLEKITRYNRFEEIDKSFFKSFYNSKIAHTPIEKRINKNDIAQSLDNEFIQMNISQPFEFAIYNNNILTSIQSQNFSPENNTNYTTPLFSGKNKKNQFILHVVFPLKKKHIISGVWQLLTISGVFIIFITFIYINSIYQLIKQKKIDAIKTDFINNMTHEFKTPIATINLALQAIKNPKIIENKEKIHQYTNIINEENKRMLTQVENVLRISQIEKKELEIVNQEIDIHELLKKSLNHINLHIKNSNGKVHKKLNAKRTKMMANASHLINVFINILENAIKYSKEAPIINVETLDNTKGIEIIIKDQGIGMGKSIQKLIFDKFYRAQSGNIHDVKGHGLGLSYAKKIINYYKGTILVDSNKGKGSTFKILLPTSKS